MPAAASLQLINVDSASIEEAVSARAAVVVAMEKENPDDELSALRAQLRDERRSRAIQRANAETARRAADCLRCFYDALLPLLSQPCFALNRDGVIILWNDAMTQWTDIAALSALGRGLEILFASEAREALEAAFRVAAHAAESAPSGVSAAPVPGIFSASEALAGATFAVLPLCYVPGCLESCLVLFQPFA